MIFGHGGRISIGEWCYVGVGTRIWSAISIEIGDRVLISHSANVFDSLTHPLQAAARHEQVKQIFTSGHPREVSLDESRSRLAMMRGLARAQWCCAASPWVKGRSSPPAPLSPRMCQLTRSWQEIPRSSSGNCRRMNDEAEVTTLEDNCLASQPARLGKACVGHKALS